MSSRFASIASGRPSGASQPRPVCTATSGRGEVIHPDGEGLSPLGDGSLQAQPERPLRAQEFLKRFAPGFSKRNNFRYTPIPMINAAHLEGRLYPLLRVGAEAVSPQT